VASAFRWESGGLLARWILTRSEDSATVEIRSWRNQKLLPSQTQFFRLFFALLIIANTMDKEFGFVPLIQAVKQLQRSAFHDILRKQ